jgi:hypothetical protein
MGLLKTAVKVGVASSVHGRVQRRQQQRWAAEDQRQQTAPAAAPPSGASTVDRLAQLKTLGELRESGVLTEAEFDLEKQRLLHG